MTEGWLPIRYYRDFYDIPRAFVVEHVGQHVLFDCPFNDALDGYGDEYTIYRISDEMRERIDQVSWTNLGNQLQLLGVVPTTAVRFDATKRLEISAEVFERLKPLRTKD